MSRFRLGAACLLVCGTLAVHAAPPGMVRIEAGSYSPLYKEADRDRAVAVDAFYLDRHAVTNREFAAFVQVYPQWQPESVPAVFADEGYLSHWQAGNMRDIAEQPVTRVSWFAARAYCRAQGKRLPGFDEWEYAAAASEDQPDGTRNEDFRDRLLSWYSQPAITRLPDVADTWVNYWGVYGMHGVIWELVNDFNNQLVTGESRGDSELENALYCGAGAAGAVDPSDYAAFMRYALRGSYEATYTLQSMGFRCAMDALATEAQP